MAQTVSIPGTHEVAKIRLPVSVWLWNIPTFGIYTWFWWYYINNEMRNLGVSKGRRDLGTSPGVSLLALVPGAILIVPVFWTLVTTMRRIQRSQEAVGTKRMNGWVSALLWLFTFGIGGPIYTQSNLNRLWRALEQSGMQTNVGVAGERPNFDTTTGAPITGYDPETGQPVLGEPRTSASEESTVVSTAPQTGDAPARPEAQQPDPPTGQPKDAEPPEE